MTNLDSIFKSRNITLPTKVCLVKAMVFPVVMYGCESWTVKKAERQRINLKNIQATPAAQFQKNKRPNQKVGQRTKQTFLQRRYTDG